jgi:flagellar basal-body rod protein FlgG
MEQGSFEVTTNEYDIAIAGRGFFQIQTPNGETAYTRAGNFGLNADGDMVTDQGYLLDPAINIPEDTLDTVINASGEVLVKLPNTTSYSNVGQIQLAIFANEGGLEAMGNNLFMETDSSGSPTTGNPDQQAFGKLEQGILENSNVDVVEEITRLITAQRAYEMNSKVIQTSDEMMGTVSNMR